MAILCQRTLFVSIPSYRCLTPLVIFSLPPWTFDAPSPYSREFRPQPSGSPQASQPSCLHLLRPSRLGTLPSFHVRASILCAMATMPFADFYSPFRSPLDDISPMADEQISPGITHSLSPPTYLSHLLPRLPDDYRASDLYASLPRRGCLSCASCSSGRGFAYRLLQNPPHGNSLCGSANGSRHQSP